MRKRTDSAQATTEFVIILLIAVVLLVALIAVFHATSRGGERNFELIQMNVP